MNNSGTYLYIYWAYSTTGISGLTTDTATVKYRQKGTSTWTTAEVANAGSAIVGAGAISTNYQYEVQYSISDGINPTATTFTDTIPTGYTTVDYKAGGKGVAFGKVSEKDEFECNMVADFKNEISWESISHANTDYNTMKKSGAYYMTTGCSNAPDGSSYCRLFVMGSSYSNDIVQIVTAVTSGKTWVRGCANNVWHDWRIISQLIPRATEANFNSLTENGIYYSSSAPTGSNYPIAITGVLEVFNMNGIVMQRYTSYNGQFVYQRGYYSSSGWTGWCQTSGRRAICAMYPSSRLAITGASWTTQKVALGSTKSNTSSGYLTASNGGIRIGKGISTVKISASLAYHQYATTGEVDLQILKNSTVVAGINGSCTVANYICSLTTNPIAINVVEGDIIYLAVCKGSANSMTILNDHAGTSLTVEVIG